MRFLNPPVYSFLGLGGPVRPGLALFTRDGAYRRAHFFEVLDCYLSFLLFFSMMWGYLNPANLPYAHGLRPAKLEVSRPFRTGFKPPPHAEPVMVDLSGLFEPSPFVLSLKGALTQEFAGISLRGSPSCFTAFPKFSRTAPEKLAGATPWPFPSVLP